MHTRALTNYLFVVCTFHEPAQVLVYNSLWKANGALWYLYQTTTHLAFTWKLTGNKHDENIVRNNIIYPSFLTKRLQDRVCIFCETFFSVNLILSNTDELLKDFNKYIVILEVAIIFISSVFIYEIVCRINTFDQKSHQFLSLWS